MNKKICIDIDGICTLETHGFGKEYYPKRTPNTYTIETLQDYHRRGFKIILYTARYQEDREMTEAWLKKYNVHYDELILGKPQAEFYADDRAVNQLDREILCLSGGLDSIIAWHWLEKPQCIQIDFGHRYYIKEYQCVNRLHDIIPDLHYYRIKGPNLREFEIGDKAYISQRNFHIALLASHYGNKIYIGGIKGDKVEDKTPEAFKTMSYAMNFIKKPEEPEIKIESPFWNMTKTDIIKWFLANYPRDYVIKVLKTSVSCYDYCKPGDKSAVAHWGQCGECSACFRKWIALEAAGIKSWEWFTKDIREWKGIKDYITRIKKGEYDMQRSQETKTILEKYGLWE